jgi:hypothetical protein
LSHTPKRCYDLSSVSAGGDTYIPIKTHKRRPAKNDAV